MPWKNGNPVLYTAWRDMLDRCYNPKFRQFKDYGGRGIKVCEQWRTNFKQFQSDMLPTHKRGLTLDRKDNNKDYYPANCRWATRKQQARNKRNTRYVVIEGQKYMVVELRDICGLKWDTIVERAEAGLTYKQVISKDRRYNLEGFKLGAIASSKARKSFTHCRNGHLYTPQNTEITKEGWRRCMDCRHESRDRS